MKGQAEVRCYALRRVNPFLGVEQVLEMPRARARSTNGIVWQLELLAQAPAGWGSLNLQEERELCWHLHALWSENEGQVNFPKTAIDLGGEGRLLCESLIDTIKANTGALPFTLRDTRELWLLDGTDKRPLALLFSMLPDAVPPSRRLQRWHACRAGDGMHGQRPFPDIQRLEAAVRERAGFNASTLWVTWSTLRTSAVAEDGRRIDPGEFPILGLREDWPNEQEMRRVSWYIEWIAASLLTLPYLPDAQRARLEACLLKRAFCIEYHWRLYPRVLDREKIAAARVASRLKSSECQ